VDLHKSTLFHHFADKREIVGEVTRRLMAEVMARLVPLERGDPPHLETVVAVVEGV
jgi:AcrR family transcriptional regulator